jgi:hypothetical protein
MAAIYYFERGAKTLFSPCALDRRDDQVFSICGDLEGCIHRDMQQI